MGFAFARGLGCPQPRQSLLRYVCFRPLPCNHGFCHLAELVDPDTYPHSTVSWDSLVSICCFAFLVNPTSLRVQVPAILCFPDSLHGFPVLVRTTAGVQGILTREELKPADEVLRAIRRNKLDVLFGNDKGRGQGKEAEEVLDV